jgi:hypothetical protein
MFLPFVAHVAAPISGPILHLSNLSSFWGAALKYGCHDCLGPAIFIAFVFLGSFGLLGVGLELQREQMERDDQEFEQHMQDFRQHMNESQKQFLDNMEESQRRLRETQQRLNQLYP